jgi:hypothetical protein
VMSGSMTMERMMGAMPMPGMTGYASPMAPTMGMPAGMMVPRCTMKMEKTADGCKIVCECDNEMACSTLQSLCKSLAEQMCGCCMMMNGMCCCTCNFTMAMCKVEYTKKGVTVTCKSGDKDCCQMIQSCCDCMASMLAAGCCCYLCFGGTPVCCGCAK